MRKRLAAKPDTAVPRYSRTQLVTLRRIVTDEAVMKLVETSEVIRDEARSDGMPRCYQETPSQAA